MKAITEKQKRILDLADEGLSPYQIGQELSIEESTVKAQLTRIRKKVIQGAFTPEPLPLERQD